MKVAVFGCLHGMLNEMYREVDIITSNGTQIDLVIVCGDCQTIRHADDLKCLSVPNKYKKLGDFWEYYSGKKKIPILTIFVGGNHEASNYLMTLPYGGWVCENFYYLGYGGVIRYRGLRIAGISGIFNAKNCNRGRFEALPLDEYSLKSVYHTRRLDVFRMHLLANRADDQDPIDVFISHDWPSQVYKHGNEAFLLRIKPCFYDDVKSREGLGNPMTKPLLYSLKPKRWFAAHLHCKFFAVVKHDDKGSRKTHFLSLNKIENRRHYVEVMDLETRQGEYDDDLYYDEEWLTILRKTACLESKSADNVHCPDINNDEGKQYIPNDDEIKQTVEIMNKTGGLKIKRNFEMTEPVIYDRPHGLPTSSNSDRSRFYPNFQTQELCHRLSLYNETTKGVYVTDDQLRVGNTIIPRSKSESKKSPIVLDLVDETSQPAKRRAVGVKHEVIELDDDGCLPFYVDTKSGKQ